jgi:hypothetical protein
METGSSGHHSPVGSFQRTGYLVPQSAKIAPLGRICAPKAPPVPAELDGGRPLGRTGRRPTSTADHD